MRENKYSEFCTGCGLCSSLNKTELLKDEKGFYKPSNISEKDIEFFEKVCPVSGNSIDNSHNLWGTIEHAYSGWSNDTYIRRKASSGGILTSIAIFLLENDYVDGIIQTKYSKLYGTKTVINRTRDEVISCSGSRYSISSPLLNIDEIIKNDERYAFIGKPCDVTTLRLAILNGLFPSDKIKYFLSFFCAGMPSQEAQKKLLVELGYPQSKIDSCYHLDYRGNGWPGRATLYKDNDIISSISYNDSWGKILGRDVCKMCRFCIDGIGEGADIACADYWYLDANNEPKFDESEGRNIILSRTQLGTELLNTIHSKKYITLKEFNINELRYIQPYQYIRRTTMRSKVYALKFMGKSYPTYNRYKLKSLSAQITMNQKVRNFVGTIKRIYNKKI